MTQHTPLLVLKFGGTSLAHDAQIQQAIHIIKNEALKAKVVVVVSARGNLTDQLLLQAKTLAKRNSDEAKAEYDTVLTAGEQISAGLMALALQNHGLKARSYCSWQLPIITTQHHCQGKILSIDPSPLYRSIAQDEIPVVAGFQGIYYQCDQNISYNDQKQQHQPIIFSTGASTDWARTPFDNPENTANPITQHIDTNTRTTTTAEQSASFRVVTLGRGGSDITAVSLAACMSAKCKIFTDVNGVYTTDPETNHNAQIIEHISHQQLVDVANAGAAIIHHRAAIIAQKYDVALEILSTFDHTGLKTMTVKQSDIEAETVIAVVNNASISLLHIKIHDNAKNLGNIFTTLLNNHVKLHEFRIHQNEAFLFFDDEDLEQAEALLSPHVIAITNYAFISVIGHGLQNSALILGKIMHILSQSNISPNFMQTTDNAISFAIHRGNALDIANKLHDALILTSY